ncbi:Bug family tripartite tricarboxylate transporter substrate binding protein [Ramlibacter sp.]|uniref:Bug family tripartite tricarboxylate transporter substrate binding protein n=1 Tax=Ramlibacter sp. TaxID=1917967 RepID=UPI003D11B6AB
MTQRVFTRRAASALALSLAATLPLAAHAQQDYPNKPIRLVVSFAAGGLTDVIARAMQPKLSEALGQPIVIENRPGAGGTLAEALVARAPADGYTLLMTADSVPANPHLIPNLSYDAMKDLIPVAVLTRIPLVMLVNPSLPVNNVKELVAYAQANKGKVSYASPGIGTSNHLYFEVFKDLAKADIAHVAYKGGGPAMADVLAGHVPVTLISSTLAAPQVAAGKVRAIAVTSETRSKQMPNVPTFVEQGFADFKPQQWNGLFVPAGTPAPIVAKLTAEFSKVLKSPEVVARLTELGAEPVMSTQQEFSSLLRRDYDVLGKLIRERGIKAQ